MRKHIGHSCMELLQRSTPPGRAAENNPGNELEINVIFTDPQGTLSALRTAGALAHQLQAHINLLVPRVVPYAFPLANPPVSIQFTEHRLLDLARQGAQGPMVISVQLYLCGDGRVYIVHTLIPLSHGAAGRARAVYVV